MKNRIVAIIISLTLIPCLSGCGTKSNKELTCVQENKSENLTIRLNMTFKNNKLDTMNIHDIFDMTDSTKTEEEIKNIIRDDKTCKYIGVFEDSYEPAILTCRTEVHNKILTITTSYDINKIEDDIIKSDKSYKKIKGYFEMQGLTCK